MEHHSVNRPTCVLLPAHYSCGMHAGCRNPSAQQAQLRVSDIKLRYVLYTTSLLLTFYHTLVTLLPTICRYVRHPRPHQTPPHGLRDARPVRDHDTRRRRQDATFRRTSSGRGRDVRRREGELMGRTTTLCARLKGITLSSRVPKNGLRLTGRVSVSPQMLEGGGRGHRPV